MSTPDANHPLTSTAAVASLAILCCALWGSAIPAIRLGYQLFAIAPSDIGRQLVFAGLRFFSAGAAVTLVHGARTHDFWLAASELKDAAKIGFFQTFAQQVLGYIGLAHATGVSGSITQGTGVFTMLLASCLVFRMEKMTAGKALGCLLGFAGLAAATGVDGSFGWGEALMLCSTICAAAATALMRQMSQKRDPVKLTGWQFMFGGAGLLAAGLLLGGRISVTSIPQLGILAWLSAVSAIGFSTWSLLLRDNDISRIAVYQFLIPVFGVLISLAVLGSEGTAVGPNTAIALVLISLGIQIVNRAG